MGIQSGLRDPDESSSKVRSTLTHNEKSTKSIVSRVGVYWVMYKHVECIWSLDFVESNNVHWLNKVFKTNNLVFKIVHHNFVVFNDTGNLKLLDTITKKSKSGLHERMSADTYPISTSLPVPQRRPSIVIDLMLASSSFMSVSSSHGLISMIMLDLAMTLPFLDSFSSFFLL